MQEIITLACTVCDRRNYTASKNKKNKAERLEYKKFCKWCKKHTVHKETK
ncbi:MAG: 50S ribosomal protein L33 [Candidatus Margulisiibacteriota bacterium]